LYFKQQRAQTTEFALYISNIVTTQTTEFALYFKQQRTQTTEFALYFKQQWSNSKHRICVVFQPQCSQTNEFALHSSSTAVHTAFVSQQQRPQKIKKNHNKHQNEPQQRAHIA
jgi:heme/copper-type cytochrome/quinol oxidase subunit 3